LLPEALHVVEGGWMKTLMKALKVMMTEHGGKRILSMLDRKVDDLSGCLARNSMRLMFKLRRFYKVTELTRASFQEFPTIILCVMLVIALSLPGTFVPSSQTEGVLSCMHALMSWHFLARADVIQEWQIQLLEYRTHELQKLFKSVFGAALGDDTADGKAKKGNGTNFPKYHA
jgi:hypothetical protein